MSTPPRYTVWSQGFDQREEPKRTYYESPWLAILYAFNQAMLPEVWFTKVVITEVNQLIAEFYLKVYDGQELVTVE